MLPEGYKQGLARVSEIVSYAYPFDENSEARFIEWLDSKGIKQKDYMNIAQTWGTEIHLTLENYMEGINYISPLYEEVKNEINFGKQWIDELNSKYPGITYLTENYVRDEFERFNGTLDLVRVNEKTKEVWLYDYKSWEVAKRAFGLETKLLKSGKPGRPTDKLKKLALQLSLYAIVWKQRGYKVMGGYGVWLHDSGCYEYEVELRSDEDLNNLLTSFFIRNQNIPPQFNININYNTMQIEIQSTIPDMPFSKAGIVIQNTDFEGQSYEDKIKEGVKLQKYLLKQYIEGQL